MKAVAVLVAVLLLGALVAALLVGPRLRRGEGVAAPWAAVSGEQPAASVDNGAGPSAAHAAVEGAPLPDGHCRDASLLTWRTTSAPTVPLVARGLETENPVTGTKEFYDDRGYQFVTTKLGSKTPRSYFQGPSELMQELVPASAACTELGVPFAKYAPVPGDKRSFTEICFGRERAASDRVVWVHVDGDSRFRDVFYDICDVASGRGVREKSTKSRFLHIEESNILISYSTGVPSEHDEEQNLRNCPLAPTFHFLSNDSASAVFGRTPDAILHAMSLHFPNPKLLPFLKTTEDVYGVGVEYMACHLLAHDDLHGDTIKVEATVPATRGWTALGQGGVEKINSKVRDAYPRHGWRLVDLGGASAQQLHLLSDPVHWNGVGSLWFSFALLNAMCPYP